MESKVPMLAPTPEKLVPEFAQPYVAQQLIIVRNPEATNGKAREGEVNDLIQNFEWSNDLTQVFVDTSKNHEETARRLAERIHEVDSQALPGSVTIVMVIGGDATADAALNGVIAAAAQFKAEGQEPNAKTLLALAEGGNKCDTATNAGTAGCTLSDILLQGAETDAHPLDVVVQTVGGIAVKRATLHSFGAGINTLIAEGANDPSRRERQKQKKAKQQSTFMSDMKLAFKGIRAARKEPRLRLISNNAGIKNGTKADVMVAAGGRTGGRARFDASLASPDEISIAAPGNAVSGAIARSNRWGRGPGDRWISGGAVKMLMKGLRKIQIAGEVFKIQDNPDDPVFVQIGRAAAVTMLSVSPSEDRNNPSIVR